MYKIYLNEELTEESYNKLIDYALSKSDAFMVAVYRHSENIESVYSLPDRSMFESDELYKRMVKRCKEAKKEAYIKKDIFDRYTEPVLNNLKAYLIKKRDFPTEWPGIKVIFTNGTRVDIYVYRVCNEVKPFLLQTKGLFKWKYPYFPDDLSFFKNGYCWFYTVAHEEYGFIFVESHDEINCLEEMGLNFKFAKCDDDEQPLFYEEYQL